MENYKINTCSRLMKELLVETNKEAAINGNYSYRMGHLNKRIQFVVQYYTDQMIEMGHWDAKNHKTPIKFGNN